MTEALVGPYMVEAIPLGPGVVGKLAGFVGDTSHICYALFDITFLML
jgi:hypothetical protein